LTSQYRNIHNIMILVVSYLIYLLWYCTFRLYDSLSMPLGGIGSIGLVDGAILILLWKAAEMVIRREKLDWIDRIAIAIGLWMLLATVFNIVFDDLPVRVLIRSTIRIVPAWFALPLLRRLSRKNLKRLLWSAAIIGVFVAILHSYILLANRRDLIESLYYAYSLMSGNWEHEQMMRSRLDCTDYIAASAGAWPGGGLLMSSVATGAFVALLNSSTRGRKVMFALLYAITSLGNVVSLLRARMLVLFVFVPLLCLYRYHAHRGIVRTTLCAIIFLAVFGLGMTTANEDFASAMRDKWSSFLHDASLTRDDSARIQDTTEGFQELMQRPLFGNGTPELDNVTSLVGGDVHTLVATGLAGGIPAVAMVMLVVVFSLRYAWRRHLLIADVGIIVVLHILFLGLINTDPVFVAQRTLIIFVLSLALTTHIATQSKEASISGHSMNGLL